MRRGRHQQQVAGVLAELFGKSEALGAGDLLAGEVGRELVGLIEHHQIPASETELRLDLHVARHLIEPDDQMIVVGEGITARRSGLQLAGKDAELQAKLPKQLITPLLDQAAGGDDQNTAGIGAHQQLADIEPSHNRLTSTGVISEDEAQGLARQQRLIDRRNLVRERLDIGGVNRHHRVEEEGQVNALGLNGEGKVRPIAIESPWAFDDCQGDQIFISPPEHALPYAAVRRPIDHLHRVAAVRNHSDHRDHRRWLQAGQRHPRRQVFKTHGVCPDRRGDQAVGRGPGWAAPCDGRTGGATIAKRSAKRIQLFHRVHSCLAAGWALCVAGA